MFSKRRRGTSCPAKATAKIPQVCYYYRRKKNCKWGDHCRYLHQLYVEKPTSLSDHLYKSEPLPYTLNPKEKILAVKHSLRKAELA
jgi:hypothetical protein